MSWFSLGINQNGDYHLSRETGVSTGPFVVSCSLPSSSDASSSLGGVFAVEKMSRGVRLSHWQKYRGKKVNFSFDKQVTTVDISTALL